MTDVTIWPLVAAAIAHVIIGSIWYHPRVFGSAWMRMSGATPDVAEKMKRRMPLYMLGALVSGLIAAYVMNYFGIAWNVLDVIGAFELGFWCWVGFAAPALFGQVLWDQKPLRLYFINSLYWLVSFVVMAVILVL